MHKTNNPNSLVDTLAERQATRNKVANTIITAKSVAKVTSATLRSDADLVFMFALEKLSTVCLGSRNIYFSYFCFFMPCLTWY